jgi:hypothetical protein
VLQQPEGRALQCTVLIQAMIFQTLSAVCRILPKGGIGPTTFSDPLRTKLLGEGIAGAQRTCAERDDPEQVSS